MKRTMFTFGVTVAVFWLISALPQDSIRAGGRLMQVTISPTIAIYLPLVAKDHIDTPAPIDTDTPTPTNTMTPAPNCPQTGQWVGTTSQSRPISFPVSDTPSCEVESLTLNYTLFCIFGGPLSISATLTTSHLIANNHFEIGGENPKVIGDFTSRTEASGTWSGQLFLPDRGDCRGSGTWTATRTSGNVPTSTGTPTATATPTPTSSPTATNMATPTPTNTTTSTPTSTATSTPTNTAIPSPSPTPLSASLFETVLSVTSEGGYADIPDNASLDFGTEDGEDFTIETYFYVSDLSYDDNFIDMLTRKDHSYSLYISFNSGSPDWLSFKLWTGFDTSVVLNYVSDLSLGWHHVAAVFDNEFTASEDSMALYLDGSRVAFSPDENIHVDWTPGVLNSSSALVVGGVPLGKAGFNGLIEEIRFSDIVRYSGTSYAVPTDPFSNDANTRALWHFDEPAGSTAFVDESDHTNHLTGHEAQTSNP